MNQLKRFLLGLLWMYGCNSYANPDELTIDDEGVPVTITLNDPATSAEHQKTIYLMHVRLNNEQKQTLMETAEGATPSKVEMFTRKLSGSGLPSAVQLGMNGVPVLDQGPHGSCATFALTGAVDAVSGRGDYVSQLCLLALGSYFEKSSYWSSGWDGSSGHIVLDQMTHFGVIPKISEGYMMCGGMSQYPVNSRSISGGTSPDEYKGGHVNIMAPIHWNTLVDGFQRFNHDKTHPFDADHLIAEIKTILANANVSRGDDARVAVGFLLYAELGTVGAQAKRFVYDDTWSLTYETKRQVKLGVRPSAGHEVVITGYDDNAIVRDDDGTLHQGVFTIRNSWGPSAGNRGDYYMTYDYFAVFVTEAFQIQRG